MEQPVGPNDCDGREEVPDTRVQPYSAICALWRSFCGESGVKPGTGWFIHPRVVVTAGYCILIKAVEREADEPNTSEVWLNEYWRKHR